MSGSRRPSIPLIIAWPLSLLFAGAVWLKNAFFAWGIFKTKALKKPVLAIGNLAMGGTGKSPMTMALVELLQAMGLKVAVLSRGYGRQDPKTSLQVTAATPYRVGGDEPVMIARRFPNCLVAVGPSRWLAAQALAEEPDIYLVDDGFQHRQLKRDYDLVLLSLHHQMPRLFPVGWYREGWTALRRAHGVVLTGWHPEALLEPWQQELKRRAPALPHWVCQFKPIALHQVGSRESLPLSFLNQTKVAAYAGIANPAPFFKSLSEMGAEVLETKALADHASFSKTEMAAWIQSLKKKGVEAVVTTEKDAVKLDNHGGFAIVIIFLSTGVVWKDQAPLETIVKKLIP